VLSVLPPVRHPDLIVGLDWHDDAGVFRFGPDLAIIQTVDFFTPIVDDPFTFGEIAAANSLSDVYAMGGEPVTAMNIVGFPVSELDLSVLSDILRGGHAMTVSAGALLVGGHSVKSPELFYGLSVLGRVHPDRVVTNAGARPGDVLVLTKPLGTGILATSLKKGKLDAAGLARVTNCMKRLNRNASRRMVACGAHAATDVTGFGFLGHLHEMTAASGVDAVIALERVPLLAGALEAAADGDAPGGLGANREHLAAHLDIGTGGDPRLDLLFDPQTSGGLLVSLLPDAAERLVAALHADGETETAVVGRVTAGTGRIRVQRGLG
jgi:selenide, water dikinase